MFVYAFGNDAKVIPPSAVCWGPAYIMPNSITRLAPQFKFPFLSTYPPWLRINTGEPLDPGKHAASIKNSPFPLKSFLGCVAVIPRRMIGWLLKLSHIPSGYPTMIISSIADRLSNCSDDGTRLSSSGMKNGCLPCEASIWNTGCIGRMHRSVSGSGWSFQKKSALEPFHCSSYHPARCMLSQLMCWYSLL